MPPESMTATSSALCHEPVVSLCDRCRGLLIRPEEDYRFQGKFFDNVQISVLEDEVCRARVQGCPICVMMWDSITTMPRETRQRDGGPLNFVLTTIYRLDMFDTRDRIKGPIPRSCVEEMRLSFDFDRVPIPYEHRITFGLRSDASSSIVNYKYKVLRGKFSGETSIDPVFINLAALPRNTGEPSRLELTKSWLRNCFENHQQCCPERRQFQPGSGPSRLIDVTSPARPKLVDTQSTDTCYKTYATLSHRWKDADMPKLLGKNVVDMKQEISTSYLTPVFQDAIELCRALRIDYLWIDALCLMQDNELDCKSEIQKMGAIYSNAYCNFSATLAAELPVGLFFDRNLTHSKAFPVTIERQGHHFECFGFSVKALTHLNDESLMQRGWVLQERLLSPRTIYFGHQLSWECGQSLANELFPKGVPGGFGNYWGSNTPYKLSRLLNTDPTLATNPAFVSNTDDTEPSKSILYERWSEIVLTYSACELSFDTDILPAISGLAQQFGELLGDVYLAGLWQSTLLRDLLWSRSSAWKASDLIPRPHSYRAPSWSWASLKSPIIWLHPDHIVSTDLVALIDSSTTLASEDPFGQVTDGYVRLSGHLCLLQRHRYVATQHPDLGDWYDVEATGDVSKSPAGARFLIPFARAPAYSLPVSNTPERMYAGRIKGLVLEAIPGQAQNTFKRLGVFTHPCGEYRTEEERRDFPEFDGFDFDHSPRQVITIV